MRNTATKIRWLRLPNHGENVSFLTFSKRDKLLLLKLLLLVIVVLLGWLLLRLLARTTKK